MYKKLIFISLILGILSCAQTQAKKSTDHTKPLIVNKSVDYTKPLTYIGNKGAGKGKHIVFVANDHEYRSEETVVALARILAKHHGFKTTVLFGINKTGHIEPGAKNIPHLEVLKKADLLFFYGRFISIEDIQLKHIVDYLERGAPIVAARTSSHGFSKSKKTKYPQLNWRTRDKKYSGGFGVQVLGISWGKHGQAHLGGNHRELSMFDIIKKNASHPILRGINKFYGYSGAYRSEPHIKDFTPLVKVSVLKEFNTKSELNKKKKPSFAGWIRKQYRAPSGKIKKARVSYLSAGASEDLLFQGTRRWFVNSVFWALGLENKITKNLNVSFVGKYNPSPYGTGFLYRTGVKPQDLASFETTVMPKNAGYAIPLKKKKNINSSLRYRKEIKKILKKKYPTIID